MLLAGELLIDEVSYTTICVRYNLCTLQFVYGTICVRYNLCTVRLVQSRYPKWNTYNFTRFLINGRKLIINLKAKWVNLSNIFCQKYYKNKWFKALERCFLFSSTPQTLEYLKREKLSTLKNLKQIIIQGFLSVPSMP